MQGDDLTDVPGTLVAGKANPEIHIGRILGRGGGPLFEKGVLGRRNDRCPNDEEAASDQTVNWGHETDRAI
jgi:hypothetical protein